MYAISIKQPWASLIVSGAKTVENRSWLPKYRGKLAIVSSARIDPGEVSYAKTLCSELGVRFPHPLPTGGLIGVVDFVGSIKAHPTDPDKAIWETVDGDTIGVMDDDMRWWYEGDTGWVLRRARQCRFVPVKGRLGLYQIDDQFIDYLDDDTRAYLADLTAPQFTHPAAR